MRFCILRKKQPDPSSVHSVSEGDNVITSQVSKNLAQYQHRKLNYNSVSYLSEYMQAKKVST